MRDANMSLGDRILRIFYLATPVFIVADYALGMDFRVSFLDNSPYLKMSYYLICFCIGILMYYLPKWIPLIGIVECALNMLMLTSSILIPHLDNIDAVASGLEIVNPLDNYGLINYLLSGTILIVSFRAKETMLQNC